MTKPEPKDYIDVLVTPIAKALCHVSRPECAPKRKVKPVKKSRQWASAGLRSKV